MDNGMNNLDKLTDQIFREGIMKAEKQSKKMIEEVEENKGRIIQEAQDRADKIVAEARRDADRLKRSIENELSLKGEQFISDLKARIEDLLSEKILKTNIEKAFNDQKFMQTCILEILKNWNGHDDIELILPADLKKQVNNSLVKSIRETLPNLTVTYGSHLSDGFRIARKSNNYQISFSNQDFIEIFRSYLSEQANKLLFK